MSSETARRPIPHINHTPELEVAAVAVGGAKDSHGNPVRLCQNPLAVDRVRFALGEVARWFEDPAFYVEGEQAPAAELAAVDNLILLAILLREHLRAGNA